MEILLIILLEAVIWQTVPKNCDPVDIENQPENVREALIEMGYLVWMENCLKQKALQEQDD